MLISRITLILLLSTSAFAQTAPADRREKGLFIVTRDYKIRPFPEAATIVLEWDQLKNHKTIPESGDFEITDSNFGKKLTKKVIDANADGEPDRVVIEYVFESDEPVFSFSVRPNGKAVSLSPTPATAVGDTRLKVTYLTNKQEVANWPDKIIESTMSFYPDPATLPIYAPGNYSYEYAFFLNAMFARWKETQNQAYFSYIKKWADRFIDSHGYLNAKHYNVAEYRLDDILPGRIFLSLYEVTKDGKYKAAADQLRQQLKYQPRTSDGGYWHKQMYPYQMWLDGVYMADIFTMQYAKMFGDPSMYREAMQQINLVYEHNSDPGTGLLYHGWDESGNPVWSNEETGTSPEFWARGIGWYYMALIECIEYIPLESQDRKILGQRFRDMTKPIQKFQDEKSGLWYQVINKSFEPRNWLETSSSAMFAYAFAKGNRVGIFDKSYLALAKKTFNTFQQDYIFFDDQGRLYFDGTVKIGTLNPKVSKGDLDYYVTTERRVNDYKGLGALLYLSMELD